MARPLRIEFRSTGFVERLTPLLKDKLGTGRSHASNVWLIARR